MNPSADRPTLPWWRVGTMWLVIGGPLAVVVAATATAVVAARGADTVEVVDRRVPAEGAEAPAIQARNHAAVGTRR
jgi:hypothetical protein